MNIFSPLQARWQPVVATVLILASAMVVFLPAWTGGVLIVLSLALLPLVLWGLGLAAAGQALAARAVLLRPANIITLARLGLGVLVGLLGGLHVAFPLVLSGASVESGLGPQAVLMAVLVSLSFIMDCLDGQAARFEARQAVRYRTRQKDKPADSQQSGAGTLESLSSARAVGGWLDMETDSLLFSLYALLLVVLTPVPLVFLSVGLFRSVFGLLFKLLPPMLEVRPWFSWTAKTIAAVTEVCLCILFLLEAGLGGSAMAATSWAQGLWLAGVYLPVGLLSFSFATEGILRLV